MAVEKRKNQSTGVTERSAERELVITRIFDAPRELVWKAWTEPEHFKKWWGPKNFTAPVIKIDLRVGGGYLYCMRSSEGQEFWTTGAYREIVPMERLVYTDSFSDAEGNPVPASHYGVPGDWPSELLVTVTFEEVGSKTKMTLRQVGIPAGVMSEMAVAGWNESFDKLAEGLSAFDDLPAGLARPARRALTQAGYTRLDQVSRLTEAEIAKLHGMGPKAINQIRSALAARGKSFA